MSMIVFGSCKVMRLLYLNALGEGPAYSDSSARNRKGPGNCRGQFFFNCWPSRRAGFSGRRSESVGAGREYEIGLREPIDTVGPDRDAGLPPAQAKIRVVIYRLRELADFVYKVKR